MDAEALKIILSLKEENALLKRAIADATIVLQGRKNHIVIEYGMPDVSFLFSEIRSILNDFQNIQQSCNRERVIDIDALEIALKELNKRQHPGFDLDVMNSPEYIENLDSIERRLRG